MTEKERELWTAFLRSGKPEDYVRYFEESQREKKEP